MNGGVMKSSSQIYCCQGRVRHTSSFAIGVLCLVHSNLQLPLDSEYRDTSLIRKRPTSGPYPRPMPMTLHVYDPTVVLRRGHFLIIEIPLQRGAPSHARGSPLIYMIHLCAKVIVRSNVISGALTCAPCCRRSGPAASGPLQKWSALGAIADLVRVFTLETKP